jgi:hypothetical protein
LKISKGNWLIWKLQHRKPSAKRDFADLETLAEDTGKNFIRGILLYGGKEVVPFGDCRWAWPISTLWQLPAP